MGLCAILQPERGLAGQAANQQGCAALRTSAFRLPITAAKIAERSHESLCMLCHGLPLWSSHTGYCRSSDKSIQANICVPASKSRRFDLVCVRTRGRKCRAGGREGDRASKELATRAVERSCRGSGPRCVWQSFCMKSVSVYVNCISSRKGRSASGNGLCQLGRRRLHAMDRAA